MDDSDVVEGPKVRVQDTVDAFDDVERFTVSVQDTVNNDSDVVELERLDLVRLELERLVLERVVPEPGLVEVMNVEELYNVVGLRVEGADVALSEVEKMLPVANEKPVQSLGM